MSYSITMTQAKIKTKLRAARKLIDQPDTWTQEAMGPVLSRDEVGKKVARCAYGAIAAVTQDRFGETDKIRRSLMASINSHIPAADRYLGLTSWNDEPERTHAEVVLAFDRAIEEA